MVRMMIYPKKRQTQPYSHLGSRSTSISGLQSFALTFAHLHELLHLLNTRGFLRPGWGHLWHAVVGHGKSVHGKTLGLFFLEKLELSFQQLQARTCKVEFSRFLSGLVLCGFLGNRRQEGQWNILNGGRFGGCHGSCFGRSRRSSGKVRYGITSCHGKLGTGILAEHLSREMGLIAEEVLMVISTEFRSRRDSGKVPSIQFTSKAAVFSLARKELGHDRLAENAAVTNHKGLSVGQPANGICVGFVIQNLVQAHRKDLGIVIFVIRVVSSGLLVGFTGAHGRVVEYGSMVVGCKRCWLLVGCVFFFFCLRGRYVDFLRRRRNQRSLCVF
mmetsp:Transcript_22362/g.42455  ORF Transcript_22362/g.42455 Transcript_22362/m.42455 type:complete len:329 (+) Transcript_22362:105-1091(+)